MCLHDVTQVPQTLPQGPLGRQRDTGRQVAVLPSWVPASSVTMRQV